MYLDRIEFDLDKFLRNFEIRDAQKLQTVRAVCQQSQHDISFL